jgi:hypothetical protein
MAITVRRASPALQIALAKAHNLTVASLVGANFHADLTSLTTTDQFTSFSQSTLQVTAANAAGDITTAITLLNQLIGVAKVMMADAVSTSLVAAGAHKVPDATNIALLPAQYVATGTLATDTAAVVAAANAWKTAYNAHCAQAGVHYTNDATNTVATANAVDLPSATTLLNAEKTAVNAHISGAPAATQMLQVINA